MVILQIIIISNYLENFFGQYWFRKKLMKIFVIKTKIMALSNPYLVFFSMLTLTGRPCCVYMKGPYCLLLSSRGAASWRPSSANAQSDSGLCPPWILGMVPLRSLNTIAPSFHLSLCPTSPSVQCPSLCPKPHSQRPPHCPPPPLAKPPLYPPYRSLTRTDWKTLFNYYAVRLKFTFLGYGFYP